MVKWVVIWGAVAIASAVAAGFLAASKRRDHSFWAAWSFVFPPMLLALLFMSAHAGPKKRRRSLDDEDAAEAN